MLRCVSLASNSNSIKDLSGESRNEACGDAGFFLPLKKGLLGASGCCPVSEGRNCLGPAPVILLGCGRDVWKPHKVSAAPRAPESSIGSGRDVEKPSKVPAAHKAPQSYSGADVTLRNPERSGRP